MPSDAAEFGHELPISARVPDLGEPGTPGDVAGVRWRHPTLDDAAAICEVANLAVAVDRPELRMPLEEIVDRLSPEWTDLDQDWIVGEVDGRMVAYGGNTMPPGQVTVRRVGLEGCVVPDARRQGIGTALLAWQQRRAARMLRAYDDHLPAEVSLWEREGSAAVPLALTAGFEVTRWFIDLHRDLADPIAPLSDPDLAEAGLTITSLTPELREATRVARNDSFRDHWGSQPTTEERWARWMAQETFRPDLSSLAVDGTGEDARVVGFVLAYHDPEDTEAAGYSAVHIELVGTVRDHRGRGIAPRLLTRTLRAARSAGLERAALEVDSDSPTGAVGLYERLGFRPATRTVVLVRSW
jgi:ribosomal protein S18 acetylase RimI-like enzyme